MYHCRQPVLHNRAAGGYLSFVYVIIADPLQAAILPVKPPISSILIAANPSNAGI